MPPPEGREGGAHRRGTLAASIVFFSSDGAEGEGARGRVGRGRAGSRLVGEGVGRRRGHREVSWGVSQGVARSRGRMTVTK